MFRVAAHMEEKKDMRDLEREALAVARQHRGEVTQGVYVADAAVRMTKERAFAQMLENDPQIYEEFRKRHNAAPIVRALESSGVRLR